MRKTFLLFTSLLSGAYLMAQNAPVGARSGAMGNASTALSDIWSSYNNQAGLAWLDTYEVGAFYENQYFLSELSTQGVAAAIPVKKIGVFGVNFRRFGYDSYNDNKIGIAYARKFGEKFSAGIQMNMHYFALGDIYGSRFTVSGELSFQVRITERWTVSGHIFNPTLTPLADYDREKIATIFRVGTSYTFGEKVITVAEMEKDMEFDPNFRFGVEYHPVEALYLRGGISTNPLAPTFGVGVKIKSNFKLDASSAWHQRLGFAPQISLSYRFGYKKKKDVQPVTPQN